MRPTLSLTLAVLVFLGSNLLAQSVTVSGVVIDSSGAGVSGVTIEFSGGVMPANPVTSASGAFSVSVPVGTYEIDFLPPSTNLAPQRIAGVVVNAATNLGNVTLPAGVALSGSVVNTLGQPLVNVDMNVYDQATGEKLLTPGDNTDAAGVYSVIVPLGTFRVRANAPAGSGLVSQEIGGVVVLGATNLAPITLPPGFVLSGTVVDATTQQPLANVDIDVDDALNGGRIVTSGDDTDASGNFSVVVPAGLHHVSFEPLPGLPIQGRRVLNVSVTAATSMGTVSLDPGFLLSGTVLGVGGVAVASADIDVDDAVTGARLFTPNDDTDASGAFAVAVPAGSYVLRVEPRATEGLVGLRTATITVSGNTTIPPLNLAPGNLVSGTVSAWFGGGEAGARVEFRDPVSGQVQLTPGNISDASGQFSAVVPTGTWDVFVRTQSLSLSGDATLVGVSVSGPMSLNLPLALVPVASLMTTFGVPVVGQGGPVTTNFVFFSTAFAPQNLLVSLTILDPQGLETTLLPPSLLTLPPQQLVFVTGVPLPILPVSPSLLGLEFDLELRLADAATGVVYESERVPFIVQ